MNGLKKITSLLFAFLSFVSFVYAKPVRHNNKRIRHKHTLTTNVQNSCGALDYKSYFTDANVITQLYQMMDVVNQILQSNNIEYWVMAGTLLGAVRHCGIIPWDDDLDICLNCNHAKKFMELKPIFNQFGYDIVFFNSNHKMYRIFSINGANLSVKPECRFPFMDVFLYSQDQNAVMYDWSDFIKPRSMHGKRNVAIYADELYPLKNYKFGNFFVKGPNNPIKYLECCYGADCLSVGYIGHKHSGKSIVPMKVNLTDIESTAVVSDGIFRTSFVRAIQDVDIVEEVVQIYKKDSENLRTIMSEKVKPIFIEAFEGQAKYQLQEEHPDEYAELKKTGKTMDDILSPRFNKIVDIVISESDLVRGAYVTFLKNACGSVVGYIMFYVSPINLILQSMISRGYVKSVVSMSENTLNLYGGTYYDDLYIVSLAVSPRFQKHGFGKKLIDAMLSQIPEAKHVYLLAAESKTNIDTQQFYEHLNFKREGLLLTSDGNKKIFYGLSINTDK